MIDHFVQSGYRRIAFIGGDVGRDTRGSDRRQGFLEAMRQHGLDTSRLIAAGPPPISMREGANAMARLLETVSRYASRDLRIRSLSHRCAHRMSAARLVVPDDIAIVGFGAYEIGSICVPTLTTIDAHARDIGRKAGSLLLDILDGKEDIGNILIKPELIVRESTR